MKLCECGCGQPAPISPATSRARGYVRGEPRRFVAGHHRRKAQPFLVDDRGHASPCWVWQLYKVGAGYGRMTVAGRQVLAHRHYYEQHVGPIPEGLELDHLCRVRCCVNPAHLEPVTHAENQRRGIRAKLTAEQVREIRSSGLTQMALAARYGVTQPHISAVKRGKVWSDLAA